MVSRPDPDTLSAVRPGVDLVNIDIVLERGTRPSGQNSNHHRRSESDAVIRGGDCGPNSDEEEILEGCGGNGKTPQRLCSLVALTVDDGTPPVEGGALAPGGNLRRGTDDCQSVIDVDDNRYRCSDAGVVEGDGRASRSTVHLC